MDGTTVVRRHTQTLQQFFMWHATIIMNYLYWTPHHQGKDSIEMLDWCASNNDSQTLGEVCRQATMVT